MELDVAAIAGAIAVGVAGGVASGLLGIGGGLIFVPGMVFFLGLSVLAAEATSLLAMIPVGLIGAYRQRRYGNLRLREGLVLALLSPLGVLGGVALANALFTRALELSFAAVQLYFAFELIRRARSGGESARPPAG